MLFRCPAELIEICPNKCLSMATIVSDLFNCPIDFVSKIRCYWLLVAYVFLLCAFSVEFIGAGHVSLNVEYCCE